MVEGKVLDEFLHKAVAVATALRARKSAMVEYADAKLGPSNTEVLLAVGIGELADRMIDELPRGVRRSPADVQAMIERLDRAARATDPLFKTTHASIRRMKHTLEWVLGAPEGDLGVFLAGLHGLPGPLPGPRRKGRRQ